MSKLIVANWKLHTLPLVPWKKFHAPRNMRVVICPPFPYLKEVRQFVSRQVALGAQDVFWEEKGPYTGEVAPAMIKNFGAEYVIIGHSERRKHLHETDEMIRKKIEAALFSGLKVILCIGESKEIRKRGMAAAKKFVKKQLQNDLRGINIARHKNALVIAYEPIWAIGTGVPDKPEEAMQMAKFIKSLTRNAPVLYGGSVNGKNAHSFLQYKGIDGALVGGASLKVREFEKIVKASG